MTRLFILWMILTVSGTFSVWAADAKYDDAKYCSKHFARHGDASLPTDAQRQCVIAIASTYVNGEENTTPMADMLLADDISRHALGTPPDHKPGAAAKIKNSDGTSVIAAIKNRRWSADGNQVWIVYDGYLTSDPSKPSFFVAERFTIESGLIKEILLAPVVHTKPR